MTRRVRISIPWAVALTAILLNVLWPLLANAGPEHAPSPHQHLGHQASDHRGNLDDPPNDGHGSPHCSFCTLVGDKGLSPALTGAWNTSPPVVENAPPPSAPIQVRKRERRWTPAPRAPPASFS